MKINSEKLFEFVNNLGTDEKVTFKVFEDDNYVTEIYWDGENFQWEPGTFTSGMLFNPLVDFVEVEDIKEKQESEKINYYATNRVRNEYAVDYIEDGETKHFCLNKKQRYFADKINTIIDKLNSMEVNK